jgi:hypothetical protein
VLVVSVLLAAPAGAQTELSGPARDIARAAIIYPVVFDPLQTLPLTPGPQVAIDAHGSDISGVFHAAVRSGDDSYGIIVSAPLSTNSTTTVVDPRGLRNHASLGFHLTNIIWRPKARRVLEQELGPDGFLRLSEAARAATARTIETMDAVDVPWVVFIHADYRFNRASYNFTDPLTLEKRTDTRLNDTASMMAGLQLFARPRDPGYFFGFSYTYSAVFELQESAAGLPAEGPTKIRGNLVRIEVRRPLVSAHLGFNPSFAYEKNSGVRTVDAAAYWMPKGSGRAATGNLRGFYVGVRVGDRSGNNAQSAQGAGGGLFATAFVGSSLTFMP